MEKTLYLASGQENIVEESIHEDNMHLTVLHHHAAPSGAIYNTHIEIINQLFQIFQKYQPREGETHDL